MEDNLKETPAHKLWREGIERAKALGILPPDKLA